MNFFSIIIPVFNAEATIVNCLDSIINQSIANFEAIIVDDSSSDNSFNLISDYIHRNSLKNFKLIRNQLKGPGSARNCGVANSSGNYLCFLDADDSWTKYKLQCVQELIKNNPNINFIIHNEYFINSAGKISVLNNIGKIKNVNDISASLYITNFVSTSAAVVCKKLFEKSYGFDNTLTNAQDYDLWLTLSKNIHLGIIENCLGYYLENNLGITAKPYRKRVMNMLKIYWRHRSKVNLLIFCIQILKCLFSPSWFRRREQ